MEAGADPEARSGRHTNSHLPAGTAFSAGDTPADLASRVGHHDCIQAVESHRAAAHFGLQTAEHHSGLPGGGGQFKPAVTGRRPAGGGAGQPAQSVGRRSTDWGSDGSWQQPQRGAGATAGSGRGGGGGGGGGQRGSPNVSALLSDGRAAEFAPAPTPAPPPEEVRSTPAKPLPRPAASPAVLHGVECLLLSHDTLLFLCSIPLSSKPGCLAQHGQHGLSSNAMALITSPCAAGRQAAAVRVHGSRGRGGAHAVRPAADAAWPARGGGGACGARGGRQPRRGEPAGGMGGPARRQGVVGDQSGAPPTAAAR